jgi:D-serine dehydratase
MLGDVVYEDDALITRLRRYEQLLWLNASYEKDSFPASPDRSAVADAEARLARFAPFIAKAFPVTSLSGGLIESELQPIPNYRRSHLPNLPGNHSLFLKGDHALPVSGSIKARGGIYEVLKYAETVAFSSGMLRPEDDYSILTEDRFTRLFSSHRIAVGSTGNLGLSIGIMAAKLGFRVDVHMSQNARTWKKDMLRALGVTVHEYSSDYSEAVRQGRKQSESESDCHFIDDENSIDLFLGYAVAGRRLAGQLRLQGVSIGGGHQLIVYIPCGVGGGPGGLAFGLKSVFGPDVHVFFAEPTHSPCMLLGLYTGLDNAISVQDIGVDNITQADGLAVARPSGFVGKTMKKCIAGLFTVSDGTMQGRLRGLHDSEGVKVELSAAAGFLGPELLTGTSEGSAFLQAIGLSPSDRVCHIVWTTGGSMVPEAEMNLLLK